MWKVGKSLIYVLKKNVAFTSEIFKKIGVVVQR